MISLQYTRMRARRFLQSQTVREFVGFICAMDEAVRGARVSDPCHVSAPVQAVLAALRQLSAWADEIPPARQAMRYGNPAYRCESLFFKHFFVIA
jgi:serine/threonine-protein phosphatase 2A activator